ncbi:NAD(P)-binding protein [Corynespora cassiicola Philippines]|uniref:NAD(P)-binding protein n=1 Tax=Corynespora cassiicola Philippines TaxID=1448308 RepID=A0A2T2NK16_CORCC|nr:NAD(P)-binding protein [Corynespora cassiicola Philippines]
MPPIAPGSLILVTGANGYIAGITIQLLLTRGYHVRGTVPDMSAPAKEQNVKSIVYTGSQAACVELVPGRPYHLGPETFNEGCRAARTLPPSTEYFRSLMNYSCAKLEAEQGCFRWVEENKPHFTFNTVVPNINFGTVARPDKTGFVSSSGLLQKLWEGNPGVASIIPPEWYVDVEDTALLHLAALTLPDVQNERIIAIGHSFCYKDILNIFKKAVPERKFLDTLEENEDCCTVDNSRSTELLRRMGKEQGFSTLEEGVMKWIPLTLKAEEHGWLKGDGAPKTLGDDMLPGSVNDKNS